ncbi:MAG: tetrahydromethanopterin S-methyltransferase subunit D [Methanosarcinaceae archaeon]|nr:tetrahydromethanopterin S-methyltransferase subunit D [Methanosarcinaceae archaeon]NKQ38674.1 tetrahydromethanopterin S-methyltransferase subunit D [Methanosarcinales archaeon]
MIDILMDNILYVFLITLGGVLISWGVHFVPVGGAPAAMAQATGVGTGTVQLAAGAGLTGLVSAAAVLPLIANYPEYHALALVLASGTIGAMIMISCTMLVGSWVYSYGVGCPPASAKIKYDPITKNRQDIFVSQGTEGHGVPTICFVSGAIGGGLGGLGGAMIYYATMGVTTGLAPIDHVGIASIFSIGIFFVNAVIASYNIGGTIEGVHDPKFKKWPKAVVSSGIVTFLCGLMAVITIGGL